MTVYQKAFAKRAPDLNELHVESLAYAIVSKLNGMPSEFFDDVIGIAREMGPVRLAEFHEDMVSQR